jgi:ABC-type multidrug transport system fused ATPase/permease subunit
MPNPVGPTQTARHLYAFLRPYLQPHRAKLVAVLLLSALGTALGLIPPLIARHLVDHVLIGRHFDTLLPVLAAGFGLSALAMGIGALGRWLYVSSTLSMLATVRETTLSHLLHVPAPLLHQQRSGDLISRLNNDVAEVQRTLTDGGMQVVVGSMQLIGTATWLLILDWRLALASMAVSPLLWLVLRVLRPQTMRLARDLRAMTGEVMAFLTETVQGAGYIQAHDLQRPLTRRYADWNGRFNATVMRQQFWNGVAGAVPSLVLSLNALLVLSYGSLRIQSGAMTIGTLLAFSAFQWRFFAPLRGFVGLGLRVQQAEAARERIAALWELPAGPPSSGSGPQATGKPVALQCRDVSFAYTPGQPVLAGLTATVPAGRITAVMGANGAGKTTLIHLLLGLLAPEQGEVLVDGEPLTLADGGTWRARTALVSQDGVFFHAQLAETLRLGAPDAADPDLWQALDLVGLGETVRAWPDGLATSAGDRGLRLSGGQRQRLSLARAWLRRPDLLILDEATSALDMLGEGAIWTQLSADTPLRTTLVVTHRPAIARQADHVIVLADGRVVAEGPPADVLSRLPTAPLPGGRS